MLHIKAFQFNAFSTNCFIAWDDTLKCIIIDPGMIDQAEKETLSAFISEEKLIPQSILLTHGHCDHIYGVKYCKDLYDVPVYMNSADITVSQQHAEFCQRLGLPKLELDFEAIDVKEEDKVGFGTHELIAIQTPGHTPGGLCWLCISEKVMFSGDTLFKGTIGRSDMPGGDYDQLMESIKGKLIGLAGDIDVLPGHGPSTNIAEEVQNNPFLAPFNEEIDNEEAAANAIEPNFGE